MKPAKTELRELNETGINDFRDYLDQLRMDATKEPPYDLLCSDATSTFVGHDVNVEYFQFSSKYDIAQYLTGLLKPLSETKVVRNRGLWTWLSLFFFDQVCPLNDNKRKVRESARYILDVGNWQAERRHLLATAYNLYEQLGEDSRIVLYEPVAQLGDIYEQYTARKDIIGNRNLMKVAGLLYIDQDSNVPKKGYGSRRRGGVPRRFVRVVQQLDLTYDLYGMDVNSILNLLPTEFNRWKSP